MAMPMNTHDSQAREAHSAELGLGAPRDPVGWYSRGYLPHYNNRQTLQSVTFRLADSLPQSTLQQLER